MFGETVRSYRLRQGLTQEDLAAVTGLGIRTIRYTEAGRVARPRPSTVRLLADAFRLDGAERDQFHRLALLGQAGPAGRAGPESRHTRPPERDHPAPDRQDQAVPRQLPAETSHFIGREVQLDQLDALLPAGGGGPGVAVVDGAAGIGKTALAVRWAYRVRERFPDGQLYANLRGFDPAPPLRPAQVLAQFLRALGVPSEQVPVEVDEAAARYRSLLADRRVLIVLDNAGTAEHVRPVLPGGDRCRVLVTSRNRLDGLVAREGAQRVSLAGLCPEESYALLSGLVGARRVAAEPDAAAALAELCGHLPLALRIAAAHLTAHPRQPLASYRDQLADSDRLSELAVAGDDQATVRAAFTLSYGRLSAPARRLFRLLGLVPGPDLPAPAAAVLAGASTEDTRPLLRELVTAHLADEPTPDRYALHDLLRLFAAELAERADSGPERASARTRLFHWYLHRVDAAARVLYPDLGRLDPTLTGTAGEAPEFEASTASAWLDAERANLVAVVVDSSRHGPSELSWLLADSLRGYFYLRSDPGDWPTVAEAGLAAAQAAGSELGEGAARLSLATYHWHHNRYPQAIAEATRALPLVRRAGWHRGEASALNDLANSYAQSGHLTQAIGYLEQAVAVDQRSGRRAAANLTGNLAAAYGQRGDLAAVVRHATRAVELSRRAGLALIEADNLRALGDAYHLLGHYGAAGEHHSRARVSSQEVGYPAGEANALRGLAVVQRELGADETALEHIRLALRLLDSRRHPLFESECLAVLGSLQCAGDLDAAADTYLRAWRLAHASHDRYPEAESLIGLAATHLLRGDRQRADRYAEQALDVIRPAGFRLLEGQALTARAAIRLARDDIGTAIALGEEALRVHQETGHRLGLARARTVLSDALGRAGNPGAAAEHGSAARAVLASLGIPRLPTPRGGGPG